MMQLMEQLPIGKLGRKKTVIVLLYDCSLIQWNASIFRCPSSIGGQYPSQHQKTHRMIVGMPPGNQQFQLPQVCCNDCFQTQLNSTQRTNCVTKV